MADWDAGPAPSWEPVAPSSEATSPFKDDGFNANGDGGIDAGFDDSGNGAAGGGGCRNCGQEGHFARECPEPRKMTGECFNCGQVGHNKADCTNERVARPFTGICRLCEKEGHPAAECPDRGPVTCKNCLQEGHKLAECKENRFIDYSGVPQVDSETAWDMIKKADADKDVDDFKAAMQMYVKANRAVTYDELESMFIKNEFNIHLVAVEKEMPPSLVTVNLQGKSGCKYAVQCYFGLKARRSKFAGGFPSSSEENLERLKDAGEPMEQLLPVCSNCQELGHISKRCTQERAENVERVTVLCTNCNETGHRFRDCQKPREDRNACRNCKQSGHKASDCPEPRSAEGVECKRCNETGHFAKDCPSNEGGGSRACRNCGQEGHIAKDCDQPKNPANTTCRNCDEVGHFSRDCPKPRDYSRVTCSNCGQTGHTKVRCQQPVAEDDMGSGDAGLNDTAAAAPVTADGNWNDAGANSGGW